MTHPEHPSECTPEQRFDRLIDILADAIWQHEKKHQMPSGGMNKGTSATGQSANQSYSSTPTTGNNPEEERRT